MRRVFKYVWKYKTLVIIPGIAMIIGIALNMISPYLSQIMVDRVIKGGEIKLLKPVLITIGITTILRAIMGYIREFGFDTLGTKIHTDMSRDLFDHIQSLSFSYFDGMNTGELMSRVSEDLNNVRMAIGFIIAISFMDAVSFVIASVILFKINWKLTLLTMSVMPLIAYLAFKLEKKMDSAYENISDHTAVLNTTAQENIAGVRLVKAFARERHEILKFLGLNRTNYDLNIKMTSFWARYYPIIEFLSNICVIFVVTVGGLFVINDKFSIGTLVAFNGYVWELIWPMRDLGWLTNSYGQSKASARKVFEIMDLEPEIKDKNDPVRFTDLNGAVRFENVSFKYRDEYVLKNININAAPGQTIAIMGTTGAGKTSVINLIGRYYDVSEGRVLIDGHDVRDVCLNDLRSRMAVVSQDVFLFSETISENIRLGNENADIDMIKTASKDACAIDFIEELTDGFDTIIGERGIGLSGGQKQRISIARALARDAEILILDDATSALDTETEYQLLKNLNKREKKPTTFIIAHRISAVKNADEIIFLDKGKILERGTHDELLNKRGMYYQVYSEQFKDFDGVEKEVI